MAAQIASALALAACAKIEQITLTQMQNNHDSSVGAVLGGLGGVGVGVGSLIGRGTGRPHHLRLAQGSTV
ncbi:hypothetical protein [Pseudomonas sp. PDM31]|uniref:hypothetical protein n=1 Tax=Pseudomonas sp. PDM31 TaxID=2854778 RepID=UPI001C474F28|nr:hypothetical protein [Pseudomonas sp. PDM31]MBV7476290.1 hypothetical protein [Pseudomonas sp. PDM31]